MTNIGWDNDNTFKVATIKLDVRTVTGDTNIIFNDGTVRFTANGTATLHTATGSGVIHFTNNYMTIIVENGEELTEFETVPAIPAKKAKLTKEEVVSLIASWNSVKQQTTDTYNTEMVNIQSNIDKLEAELILFTE